MKTIASETVSKSALHSGSSLAGALEAALYPVDAGLMRLLDQLFTWLQRARDRRALGRLDSHMLRDIGLSNADVEHEVSKPFWRA